MGNSKESAAGILALWNDCAPGSEVEYEKWYRTEHLADRLNVTGFLAAWRYASVAGEPKYFTYYETDSPDVLFSQPYRERLDNPSELTRKMMAGIFTNVSRTECRRVTQIGELRGAFSVTARFHRGVGRSDLDEALDQISKDENILRSELWLRVTDPSLGRSTEQLLRGDDDRIAACLLFEAADEIVSHSIEAQLSAHLGDGPSIGVYRLLCALIKERQT